MLSRTAAAASRATRTTVLALLILVAVLVPAAAAAPVPGIGVFRLGDSASIGASNLPKYSYVLMGAHKYSYITQIKSASPTTKVLAYKSGTEIADCGTMVDTCQAGVTLRQAQAHDASYPNDPWILRDAAGNPITAPAYRNLYLANVGSASYQRQWLSNVSGALSRLGFDGLYLDSVLAQVSGWSGGVYPKLYPSDSAWEGAMKSFVAYVGPQLKGQGRYVLANAYKAGPNDGSGTYAWWTAIGPYLSGLMREYWVQNPGNLSQLYDTNPCCWTGHWNGWLRLAEAARSVGADFFPLMKGHSTHTRTMTYGKASFLLVWSGGGGGFIFNPTDSVDPWNPAWTTDVGTPLAPRYQVGVGWRRDFTGGTALVNPNAFSAQTFNLGGSYVTPSGATVTSVTLQPVTGMILRRASPSTGSPPGNASSPGNTGSPTIPGGAHPGQASSAASARIRIDRIYFDSPGSDNGRNSSLNAEWIRLRNTGSRAVSLRGWTIRDRAGHVYRFRRYRLAAGRTVTIHTGSGTNRARHRHWGRERYIWDNNGDTAALRRRSGALVDRCSYSGAGSTVAC